MAGLQLKIEKSELTTVEEQLAKHSVFIQIPQEHLKPLKGKIDEENV